MKELSETILNVTEFPQKHSIKIMQVAAQKWASNACGTYKGTLLRDALDISISICEFLSTLEDESDR